MIRYCRIQSTFYIDTVVSLKYKILEEIPVAKYLLMTKDSLLSIPFDLKNNYVLASTGFAYWLEYRIVLFLMGIVLKQVMK